MSDGASHRSFFNLHVSVISGLLKVILQGSFVDAVESLGTVGLKVNVHGLRPTANLICLGKGDALTDKASRAVEQLSGFCDGEKGFGVHPVRNVVCD